MQYSHYHRIINLKRGIDNIFTMKDILLHFTIYIVLQECYPNFIQSGRSTRKREFPDFPDNINSMKNSNAKECTITERNVNCINKKNG
jgi:hypothetical protein